MWILFSLLMVGAAIGLLLVKLNSVAKNSGPVWKTADSEQATESHWSMTEVVFPLDDPASAPQPAAMHERAMTAKHS